MKVERQSLFLWRRLGPVGALMALGLVAVIFLGGCGSLPGNAAATTPTPVPAAVVALPTATAPAITPVPGANDSNAGLARVIGNFASSTQSTLAFQSPGRIQTVNVKEGDQVKKGDVIATLETDLLTLQIKQAQAALDSANARFAQTQNVATPEQIAAANAGLSAAQAAYAKLAKGPTADDLAAAKSGVDRAKAALDQAQAAYDKAGGASNPYSGLLPTSVNLQQATSAYTAAVAAYNLAKSHPTDAELLAAALQIAQAKAAVSQLTPTTENLAIAQAGVTQAQAAVDLAKENLQNATLTAPFDGTLITVGPNPGEYINPGTSIATLADLTKMQVIANVDELTLGGLKVGQKATLTVDALNGKTLPAHISKIGLLATSGGGVTSVPVTLDVDATDSGVYPGLSATVQFEAAP